MDERAAKDPLLRLVGIKKSFGSTHALSGVDLEICSGQVLGLLGENGAGKSTLVKILAGVHAPDGGAMFFHGAPFRPANPTDARRIGIAVIYQEPNLAPHLSVADNVVLGMEERCLRFFRRDPRARVRDVLARLHRDDIDVDQPVSQLGAGARQIVEVARALTFDAKVLVLDEPTSSLGARDVEKLFDLVRRLRGEGVGVLYISHFLEEVQRIADSFVVVRDGSVVSAGVVDACSEDATHPGATDSGTADTGTINAWIEAMAGRRVGDLYPARRRQPTAEIALRVNGLAGVNLPKRASFELHRGEILGIAGLCGAGRTELLRCLFGLDKVRGGEVTLGAVAGRESSPRRRLSDGMGLLVEDRQVEGLARGRSVAENLCLSAPPSRWGLMSPRRLAAAADRWIERLGIRTAGSSQPIDALSGGNQQKVAIARLMHHDVDVLCLDEPTRGVDVHSKADMYRLMAELTDAGKSILMVSSYLPELLGVCDRIAVMHRGELSEARPADAWDEHSLLAAAVGGWS